MERVGLIASDLCVLTCVVATYGRGVVMSRAFPLVIAKLVCCKHI